jgi:hypothetical protein
MGSYRRSVLKIALWLLPCFFIWDLVLGPLMSVVGVKVNAVWLEHVYSQHNLWFHYDVKSELFEQRSNLFRASFPYADQSYIPNTTKNKQFQFAVTRVTYFFAVNSLFFTNFMSQST